MFFRSTVFIRKAIWLFFLYTPVIVNCQNRPYSCEDLRTGIFFAYPKNMAGSQVYIRDSLYQQEISPQNKDTILWKIRWMDKCTYALKYVSGFKEEASADFGRKHIVLVKISSIGRDYYTYSAHIDELSNIAVISDTIWFTEQANVTDNYLFQQIKDEAVPGRKTFTDTSKYALVYVYRPGKLTNSMGNYMVYFNDYLAFAAINNTGAVYKVYKEGPLEIKSKLYKDASSVVVDVRFGKRYYVKSQIHWAVTNRLYNFRLEMKTVDNFIGQSEYDETRH